jgi:hypothetical protein
MNFEELQNAWQAQEPGAKVTISADVLLKEVRRNQQQFRRTIFWRDTREVGGCFLLFLFFTHRGWVYNDWTDCLVGFAALGVGAFMVADRFRQRHKQPAPNDSLKGCAESSLHQVNHQIWLLKNVFWWYLLPAIASVSISVLVHKWNSSEPLIPTLIQIAASLAFVGAVYGGAYWLNQFAVRKYLHPRRAELETLLANLK